MHVNFGSIGRICTLDARFWLSSTSVEHLHSCTYVAGFSDIRRRKRFMVRRVFDENLLATDDIVCHCWNKKKQPWSRDNFTFTRAIFFRSHVRPRHAPCEFIHHPNRPQYEPGKNTFLPPSPLSSRIVVFFFIIFVGFSDCYVSFYHRTLTHTLTNKMKLIRFNF